jgi:hypothetical protein
MTAVAEIYLLGLVDYQVVERMDYCHHLDPYLFLYLAYAYCSKVTLT